MANFASARNQQELRTADRRRNQLLPGQSRVRKATRQPARASSPTQPWHQRPRNQSEAQPQPRALPQARGYAFHEGFPPAPTFAQREVAIRPNWVRSRRIGVARRGGMPRRMSSHTGRMFAARVAVRELRQIPKVASLTAEFSASSGCSRAERTSLQAAVAL